MFTVIYRWRVKPGADAEFLRLWHVRTEKIRGQGVSFGSRLHQEEDGTYCAIALWPSRADWEAPGLPLPDDTQDAEGFRASLAFTLPPLTMDVIDDLWTR
ncbi:MAG: antibiotic biosynthesis monooxygenase [Candidatus Eremiobacteraeota bacterium]|nr:antibiotic biosynthesis monooxygenase [Candidatus Eremiobacteraeota bacterium]